MESRQWVARRSRLRGAVTVPASKSQSIRALLFASLARGTSHIHNLLDSPDVDAMRTACEQLGARITMSGRSAVVKGCAGRPCEPDDVIDAGNSGMILRFIGAVAALAPGYTVITGDESIRERRPIAPLLYALQGLGAFAESSRRNGRAPVIVRGPLQPGRTEIIAHDSQVLSGLLIAASIAEGPIDVDVLEVGELPWIGVTLDWFDRLGIPYARSGWDAFHLPGSAVIPAFEYTVPGDWSSASYPMAAALLTGSSIRVYGADPDDVQGDKALIGVLREMGAKIHWNAQDHCWDVDGGHPLKGRQIDVNPFIDAVTLLAVIGCHAEGQTRLTGADVARFKESDRVAAITGELRKMGAKITEVDDGLLIEQQPLHGAEVESWHDHRMALSLAVAAMSAEGETRIDGVECVSKSYHSFRAQMCQLGASLDEEVFAWL